MDTIGKSSQMRSSVPPGRAKGRRWECMSQLPPMRCNRPCSMRQLPHRRCNRRRPPRIDRSGKYREVTLEVCRNHTYRTHTRRRRCRQSQLAIVRLIPRIGRSAGCSSPWCSTTQFLRCSCLSQSNQPPRRRKHQAELAPTGMTPPILQGAPYTARRIQVFTSGLSFVLRDSGASPHCAQKHAKSVLRRTPRAGVRLQNQMPECFALPVVRAKESHHATLFAHRVTRVPAFPNR
jgi:hypothetical protein